MPKRATFLYLWPNPILLPLLLKPCQKGMCCIQPRSGRGAFRREFLRRCIFSVLCHWFCWCECEERNRVGRVQPRRRGSIMLHCHQIHPIPPPFLPPSCPFSPAPISNLLCWLTHMAMSCGEALAFPVWLWPHALLKHTLWLLCIQYWWNASSVSGTAW